MNSSPSWNPVSMDSIPDDKESTGQRKDPPLYTSSNESSQKVPDNQGEADCLKGEGN